MICWFLERLALALLAVAMAGCATRTVYVDRPGPERLVERKVYVAIPDALLPQYPIATGPLQQCPIVARDRKTTLLQAQANTDAIRKIRGQPAEAVVAP